MITATIVSFFALYTLKISVIKLYTLTAILFTSVFTSLKSSQHQRLGPLQQKLLVGYSQLKQMV